MTNNVRIKKLQRHFFMTFFSFVRCYTFFTGKRGDCLEQVIYADILFIIDLSMDYLALYITAKMLKIKFNTVSTLIASLLGASFSVFTVILKLESLVLSVIFSVIMCFVAYIGNGIKIKLKSILLFYFSNMLLGGAMTALFSAFNKITDANTELLIFGEVNTVQGRMPIAVFYIGFVLILVGVRAISYIFIKRPAKSLCEAEITINGKSKRYFFIEDSGNRVLEPISGEPIIFIRENSLSLVADKTFVSALKMGNEFYNGANKQKFRVVFYKTVSGSEMCIVGRADKITVDKKACSAWIAIGKNISIEGADGIIPSSLLS